MKIRAVAGALALLVVTAVGASAQQLESGTWTGKVIVPVEHAPQINLTFDVRNIDGKLAIAMSFADAPMTLELKEIRLEEKKIAFNFAPPNTVVRCELALQDDKSYAGDCAEDNEDMKVRMTMAPPKKDGGN